MNRKHSSFGYSLEAFSPEKAVQLQRNIPHALASPSDGLLSVQCSCGCCGHEYSVRSDCGASYGYSRLRSELYYQHGSRSLLGTAFS